MLVPNNSYVLQRTKGIKSWEDSFLIKIFRDLKLKIVKNNESEIYTINTKSRVKIDAGCVCVCNQKRRNDKHHTHHSSPPNH